MTPTSSRTDLANHLVRLVNRWKDLENAGESLQQALRATPSTDLIFLMSLPESRYLKEAELAWKNTADDLSRYLSQLQVSISITEFLS